MKLPRGHTPRVTAEGKVEVHRHDEESLARGGFGERMLRSLGWRDGDGLGVGRKGRAEAVRVTQKLDNKGVGANKAAAPATDWGDAWWERAFDQGAKNHTAGGKSSDSVSSSSSSDSDNDDSSDDASTSSSSSSSDSSDSDDGDRKSSKKRKKKKKKESGAPNRHRDGTVTSATKAEMGIARALALDPWGRFGGRDGKMARIARMEAEAAAKASAALNETLGEEKEAGKEEKKKKEKKKRKKEVDVEVEVEVEVEKEESSSSSSGGKANKKRTKAEVIIIPPLTPAAAPETPPYRPPAGWWGTSLFVHAGRLEGIPDAKEGEGKKEKKSSSSRGFTAADQEALAERTTALKAAGKRGLGAASGKKEKAVGRDWKGSKVVFGEESDGGEKDDGGGRGEGKKQKEEKKEKKKAPASSSSSPSLDVSSLKWRKATEAALVLSSQKGASKKKKQSKGVPVAELAASVAAALFSKKAEVKKTWRKGKDLEAALNLSLRSLCESSSRFEVDGKGRVKLASSKT